jgi:hypothetical protein
MDGHEDAYRPSPVVSEDEGFAEEHKVVEAWGRDECERHSGIA